MEGKNIKYVLIMGLAFIFYAAFLIFYEMNARSNRSPVLTVPEELLLIEADSGDDILLKDVTAEDPEDGDLTDQIFIEYLTPFDENMERTISYAVADGQNVISRGYRRVRYSDYKKPEFYLTGPLVKVYDDDKDNPEHVVGATSSIDGDISNRISFALYDEEDNEDVRMECSVTDSGGVESHISLPVTMLNNRPNIEIRLSEYLIRVPLRTSIDPKSYLLYMKENGIRKTNDYGSIVVQTNYNPYQEGIYEFVYEVIRANGSFGLTKLVVVVEKAVEYD